MNGESFKEWKLFVEGANDLIKRKNQHALEKITQALTVCEGREGKDRPEVVSFKKNALPYAAYALYLGGKFSESISAH